MYIIKKWLPRRRGVWTENKKIVRSILVYYSILEALLSLWYRALCTKEWRVGVWDVKVVFHIYIIIFFPVFPHRRDYSLRPRDSWWKIFRVVVFYLFHVCQRARCTVIKRFENMFRQVIIWTARTAADRKRHPSIPPPPRTTAVSTDCGEMKNVCITATREWRCVIIIIIILLLFHCVYIMVRINMLCSSKKMFKQRRYYTVWGGIITIIAIQILMFSLRGLQDPIYKYYTRDGDDYYRSRRRLIGRV